VSKAPWSCASRLIRKDEFAAPIWSEGLIPGSTRTRLTTIRTWRFDPAKKAGKPVIVYATIEVNFRLL
jgi:hypothetical protein